MIMDEVIIRTHSPFGLNCLWCRSLMVQRLFVTVSCVFGVRGARCKSFFGVQGATKHSQRVCHSQYPSTERVVLVLRFASSICVMSFCTTLLSIHHHTKKGCPHNHDSDVIFDMRLTNTLSP